MMDPLLVNAIKAGKEFAVKKGLTHVKPNHAKMGSVQHWAIILTAVYAMQDIWE